MHQLIDRHVSKLWRVTLKHDDGLLGHELVDGWGWANVPGGMQREYVTSDTNIWNAIK